jgi:hypothetical protein
MSRRISEFASIRSEGGLLPPDLLRRVMDPRAALEGLAPADYGLVPGERPNEAVTQAWTRLRKSWAEFRSMAARVAAGESATGLTNDKWVLPLLPLPFPFPSNASRLCVALGPDRVLGVSFTLMNEVEVTKRKGEGLESAWPVSKLFVRNCCIKRRQPRQFG